MRGWGVSLLDLRILAEWLTLFYNYLNFWNKLR